MDKINKTYMGAALAVSLSTVGGPFVIAQNSMDKTFLYGIGCLYALIPFVESSMRIYESKKNELDRASRKFCSSGQRLSIEQLILRGHLSLDC